MTIKNSEHLSAALDGEHNDPGILAMVAGEAELTAKWQRYHLARDLMRDEMPAMLMLDISAKVAAKLAEEPTVLAPKRTKRLPLVGAVVPLMRQGGQYAIAASVAVAMVLGVQQLNHTGPEQPFSTAPVPTIPGIQGGLSPVSLEQHRTLPRASALEQRKRMNAYMSDHHLQLRIKSQALTSPVDTQTKPSTSKGADDKSPE